MKEPINCPEFKEITVEKNILSLVAPYCPAAVTQRGGSFIYLNFLVHQSSGGKNAFLAELRLISVIFINIDLIFFGKTVAELEKLQNSVTSMQKEIYKYEGEVRQFLVDDKGSVLIGYFIY